MKNQLIHIIDQIAKEKGIDRETMFSAIETAIISVVRKKYHENSKLTVKFNSEEENFSIYSIKKVVSDDKLTDPHSEIGLSEAKKVDESIEENEEFLTKLEDVDLGRVSIQTVKQVIAQKMREAEKDVAYEEYLQLKGSVIVGTVSAIEKGTIIVDLGRAEGRLPYKEQIPKEKYRKGDRIKVYICDVQKTQKELQILLSRRRPEFLEQLFRDEVPEIEDGIIKIVSSSRDPGWRGKIAVSSNDKDIDPVGACVGVRGSRVQSVVRELSGERIDIVRWSQDIKEYIKNALLPAQCLSVKVDEENKSAVVIVEDEQLFLAIGKKGQNVKLASALTGYKINVFSKTEVKEGIKADDTKQAAVESVASIKGINNELVEALVEAGYSNVEEIAKAKESDLAEVNEMGLERARQIIESAKKSL